MYIKKKGIKHRNIYIREYINGETSQPRRNREGREEGRVTMFGKVIKKNVNFTYYYKFIL